MKTSTLPRTNASRTRSWSPPSRFSILCSRDAGSAHEVVPDRLGLARLGAVLPHASSRSRRARHLRARLLRLEGAPITRRIRAPERWPVRRRLLRLGELLHQLRRKPSTPEVRSLPERHLPKWPILRVLQVRTRTTARNSCNENTVRRRTFRYAESTRNDLPSTERSSGFRAQSGSSLRPLRCAHAGESRTGKARRNQ